MIGMIDPASPCDLLGGVRRRPVRTDETRRGHAKVWASCRQDALSVGAPTHVPQAQEENGARLERTQSLAGPRATSGMSAGVEAVAHGDQGAAEASEGHRGGNGWRNREP